MDAFSKHRSSQTWPLVLSPHAIRSPELQMIPDAGAPRRIRNPGRRGIAADLHAFVPRFPLEALFSRHPEYRRLRYELDAAERRLGALQASHASESRLANCHVRIGKATAAVTRFLLEHLPQTEPAGATILNREFSSEGELVGESETPVEVGS